MIKLLISFLVLLPMIGCKKEIPEPKRLQKPQSKERVEGVEYLGQIDKYRGYLYTISLKDGTKCIYTSEGDSSALQCKFK